MVEEELVAPRRTELALFKQHPQFGRGSVIVVRENLDNERHFVGRVAFESNLFENQFFFPKTRAFFNGALDDVTGDGISARLFNGSEKAGIALGIGASHFGGDGDFLHKFAGGGRFAFGVNLTFGE